MKKCSTYREVMQSRKKVSTRVLVGAGAKASSGPRKLGGSTK